MTVRALNILALASIVFAIFAAFLFWERSANLSAVLTLVIFAVGCRAVAKIIDLLQSIDATLKRGK